MKEKDDVQALKGEDYPALVALWDNDDDSVYDRDPVAPAVPLAGDATLVAEVVEVTHEPAIAHD